MNVENSEEKSQSEAATSLVRGAFEKVEPEARELKQEELAPVVVDLGEATRTGLETANRIQFLLPRIEAMCEVDIELIKQLRTYARACRYVHLTWPDQEGAPLNKEASTMRLQFLACAEALVRFGLADPERVAGIRSGGRSIESNADNLMQLAVLFDELPAEARAKTPIDEALILRAAELSERLRAVGVGGRTPHEPGAEPEWSRQEARQRMWTLFDRAYTECRRVVSFLRWYEGDVDELVPKLRSRPRRQSSEGEVGEGAKPDAGATGTVGAAEPSA